METKQLIKKAALDLLGLVLMFTTLVIILSYAVIS